MAGVGAPSPTPQQGALTSTEIGVLALPSALAVMIAEPPPTALIVTLCPFGWSAITRLLDVLHTTGRSMSAFPSTSYGVALRVLDSPKFSFNDAAPGEIMMSWIARWATAAAPG